MVHGLRFMVQIYREYLTKKFVFSTVKLDFVPKFTEFLISDFQILIVSVNLMEASPTTKQRKAMGTPTEALVLQAIEFSLAKEILFCLSFSQTLPCQYILLARSRMLYFYKYTPQ